MSDESGKVSKGKRKRAEAVERFESTVVESLQRARVAGSRLLVALSGGPDSTSLLVATHRVRKQLNLELFAVHANHSLRGEESEQDQQFVERLCRELDVELRCERLLVQLGSDAGQAGIEERARLLRYGLFQRAAQRFGAKFIATGHTAEDQVETVLYRIIRGTGLAGLAGIPAVRPFDPGVWLVRPLLQLQRADVVAYLQACGQPYRLDSSNRDLRFTRNRIRHELLPYLRDAFNPRVSEALLRLSRVAAEAQAVIEDRVARLKRKAVIGTGPERIVLHAERLRALPGFLVSELLKSVWSDQRWPLQQLTQERLLQAAELIRSSRATAQLPGGVTLSVSRTRVTLERPVGGDETEAPAELEDP